MRAHAASGFGGGRPAPVRGAVAAALLAVVAVVVGACGGGSAAEDDGVPSGVATTPAPTPSATASLVPPTDITAVGGVAVSVEDADWVQVADGHVWTTLGTEVAQQLDPTTGKELKSVPLGGQVCTAMDHGFDALWVAGVQHPGEGAAARPRHREGAGPHRGP